MKKVFGNKWVIWALLIVPNVVVSLILNHQNLMFALGAALGAATVVFLCFYICKTLLRKTRLKPEWIIPLSIVGAYAIYYIYMYWDFLR